MNSRTRNPFRSRIAVRIGTGFMVVLLLLSGLTWFVLSASSHYLRNSVGEDAAAVAATAMFGLDRGIVLKRSVLERICQDSQLLASVSESNSYFETLPDTEAYINETDLAWRSAPHDELTPFMYSILNNTLSEMLRARLVNSHILEYGHNLYAEVFVTNKYGATIAMAGKTSDYRQNDEVWWQVAASNGSHIGDVEYDESAGTYGLMICTRVTDANGTMIGVAKSVVDFVGLVREMEIGLLPSPYPSREIRVLTSDGGMLFSSRAYRLLEDVSDESYFVSMQGHSGYFVAEMGGRDVLFAYAQSTGYIDFTGFGWFALVGYNLADVLAPTLELRTVTLQATALLIVLGAAVAYVFTRSISRPIQEFTVAAREVSGGNLERRVEVRTQDEIGELASTFNEMTVSLRESKEDLEGKIQQRTKELDEANKGLKASNAELEQFAYVASHDMQEPLRMIRSYLEMLSRRYKGQLDSDADEFIGYAVDGVDRLQRMIDDLLALSRVGTKGEPFRRIDCNVVLNEIISNLKVAIETNDAIITSDRLPTVIGDELQLSQLFQNLLGNAMKFRSEAAPKIHVSAERRPGEWVFSVRDNGIGIDPQHFERVFVVFQRLHSRDKYPGTGIGLAICRKIAERHGGRIWVESQPGKGSTFYFSIPDRRVEVAKDERQGN